MLSAGAGESAGASTLQSLGTSDLSDSAKADFSAHDFIRYNVSISVPVVAFVFVKGTVTFSGAEKENLTLQFEALPKGDHRIFWDSVVPAGALGNATFAVSYVSIPGGFEQKSASFTVSAGGGPPEGEATYIGSTVCIGCHAGFHKEVVDAYQQSGHHFALNKLTGSAPVYPDFCPGVPDPPSGFSWNTLSYVIGGYGWKAAFVQSDGQVLTAGDAGARTQYNPASALLGTPAEFVAYDAEQASPRDCGPCHTTGYTASDNASGAPALGGSWNEDGVGCEACHGQGSRHRDNPSGVKPALDPKKACSSCHVQAESNSIKADGGLILHAQQAAELKANTMGLFSCDACHNAHASAHYDEQAKGMAIVKDCIACHTDKTIGLGMQSLQCTDCHMPYAVKSGGHITFKDPDNNTIALGDMRSHLFKINALAASPAELFSADGKSLAVDNGGKSKGLTLDKVCLGCHRAGGRAMTTYSFDQVKGFAGSVH
ncbi:MAG: multiheme c-type cytochrome [Pseudomonadota bacterium]